MATVQDILSFHNLDRTLFERLIALGKDRDVVKNIVALWLWLELIGIDVIAYLNGCRNRSVVLRFAEEAEAILDCLRQDSPPPAAGYKSIPLTASLVVQPLNIRFFYCHSDVVVRGIAYMLDNVGKLVFDDNLYSLLRVYEAAVTAAEEEGRRLGMHVPSPAVPLVLAQPHGNRSVPASEDRRSMFITFPNGHSLAKDDIIAFFTEKWGDCIERVKIERTPPGVVPIFGRIVFTSESYIGLVLNGEQLVKFVINGQELWGRMYAPRNN